MMMGATCKGSYALGTACGRCARCTQDPARPAITENPEFLSKANAWVEIFEALDIEQTMHLNTNPSNAERILCVCRGGNTRSVAVAMLLKYKYKKDALTASIEKNSKMTLEMLISWADKVIVTEYDHLCHLQTHFPFDTKKFRFVDLTRTARLRAHPFEIPFLKEIDAKLQYFLKGEEKCQNATTRS